MNTDNFLRNLKHDFSKNKSQILTGAGIGGFFLGAGFFIAGTVKAVRKIDARKKELHVDKLKAKEIFRLCWMDYIFPFAVTVVSAGMIIKSDQMDAKQIGEMMPALMVTRTLFNDYREAVKETVSEEEAEEIEQKAATKSARNIVDQADVEVFPTGLGNELFIESLTGTVFRNSKSNVVRAFAEAERKIYFENYVSVNELRDEFGLRGHACGEFLGFNQSTNNGKIDYKLVPGDYFGELCWIIQINTEPVKDFDVIYI